MFPLFRARIKAMFDDDIIIREQMFILQRMFDKFLIILPILECALWWPQHYVVLERQMFPLFRARIKAMFDHNVIQY